MKTFYFTITGLRYRYGSDFLKPGTKVRLCKDPDNKYDSEAIVCEMEGLGKIGYVANSVSTVLGESSSAGRLYDKITDDAEGEAVYILSGGVICKLSESSLKACVMDCLEDK